MGKPSAPKAPDPKETAAAQTASNIGTAISQQYLNNVNQNTPDGSLRYDQTGSYQYTDPNDGKTYDIPTFTATQTLSPQQQAIKDANDAASLNFSKLAANQSGRVDSLLSNPLDLGSLPERGDASSIQSPDLRKTYGIDFSEDRQRVEDALMQRMQGGLSRNREALEARLAAQGIRLGSSSYSAAMEDLGRQENDARMSAILGAGQEQSRLAGLEAQRAGFENQAATTQFNSDLARVNAMDQARNQAMQEAFAVRSNPINEITALMSGSQVSAPNFITPNVAQIANTDTAGIINAAHNAEMNAYGQKMGAYNSMMGGLMGLGAAGIMASGGGAAAAGGGLGWFK